MISTFVFSGSFGQSVYFVPREKVPFTKVVLDEAMKNKRTHMCEESCPQGNRCCNGCGGQREMGFCAFPQLDTVTSYFVEEELPKERVQPMERQQGIKLTPSSGIDFIKVEVKLDNVKVENKSLCSRFLWGKKGN